MKENIIEEEKMPSYYKIINFKQEERSAKRFELSVNTPAPEFKLSAIQGGEIDLSSLKGKAVLLVFSGIHCHFCLVAVKDLKKIRSDYDSTQLGLLSVYSDADSIQLKKYIERYHIPYPILLNGDAQKNSLHILNKYGVEGIPHFLLISKDGFVKWNSAGYFSGLYETLTNEIEKLLN